MKREELIAEARHTVRVLMRAADPPTRLRAAAIVLDHIELLADDESEAEDVVKRDPAQLSDPELDELIARERQRRVGGKLRRVK